jgi:diguanylate cyclase (GGDEF)-like protein
VSLSKQMVLLVIWALSIAFVGTFLVTVHQAKNYFQEQLQHNAQDTATSLSLSLSKQFDKQIDSGTMLGKVNVVFDRGYFSKVMVRDNKGAILVDRYLHSEKQVAPSWFMRFVAIENQPHSAFINHGWQQVGDVVVQTDSNLAYIALWKTTKRLFLFFISFTLLICIVSVVLIKLMFRPLKRIVHQAEEIGKRHLITMDKPPRLKEMALLSRTINSMVIKLKQFFDDQITEIEQLRSKVQKDALTGLGNRRYFFRQIDEYLSNEENFSPGFLILIEIIGLPQFNKQFGYHEGDLVLIAVAQLIGNLQQTEKLYLQARLDGPCFAMIVLEQNQPAIDILVATLAEKTIGLLSNIDSQLSYSIGVVQCRFSEMPADLMGRADKAVQSANQQPRLHYYIEPTTLDAESISSEDWKDIIQSAIEKKSFHYYCQPVISDAGIFHQELYIRLVNDGNEVPSIKFFAIAEAYSLEAHIDCIVIQQAFKKKDADPLAINLSASTVQNFENQQRFLTLLRKLSKSSQRFFYFEIRESIFVHNLELAKPFIEAIIELNHAVGLDRVGETLVPFDYLSQINLSYLKLDGSLSKDLDNNELKCDFITNLLRTTRSLDIILIATTIESEAQWSLLKQLGITYFQGNYLRKPYIWC